MCTRTNPGTGSAILRSITGTALLSVAMLSPFHVPAVAQPALNEVDVILSLGGGNRPEGIAVHQTGD